METERAELLEIERAVEACNAVAIPDPIRVALVRDLVPVANRLVGYSDVAKSLEVLNQNTADQATVICNDIAADIKAVKDHEVLSRTTDGLHKLHRQWTGLRDLFVAPMERDRKTIKMKVIAWQEGERRKAEEIQRRLQAEADAKAAREREALLKKAESIKTPEKKEALREQAAAVIAPTVHVEVAKSGLRVSKAWTVKSVDEEAFFAALVHNPGLRGYVEIDKTRMVRGKAANPSMTVPGVTFEQITR